MLALTTDYETWLGEHLLLVAGDLELKHRELAADSMRFLRGTYYLWLLGLPPEVLEGPDVPTVGDLHVENFGTWQDAQGARRWGVNDLDELAWGPYAVDLVRLATSAVICPHLTLSTKQVCSALLSTWRTARPSAALDLAAPRARHLMAMVPAGKSAKRYYAALSAAPLSQPAPAPVAEAAARTAPPGWTPSWHTRVAGTGSLGHPRLAAVAGTTARETKLLGPPTASWAVTHRPGPLPVHDTALLGRVHAATYGPEPLRVIDGWLLRRLGPDVVRIELAGLAERDARRLLKSMSRAVVNIHGTAPQNLAAARGHEASRDPAWLHRLVTAMVARTQAQYAEWTASRQPSTPTNPQRR